MRRRTDSGIAPAAVARQGSLALDDAVGIGDVERVMGARGVRWVIGVDEVGRGPLAGPVTVGAVLVDVGDLSWARGVDDSKRLTERERDRLAPAIWAMAGTVEIVDVGVDEVDELNVLGASLEGMRRAVSGVLSRALDAQHPEVLVDGDRRIPGLHVIQHTLVGGDRRSIAIASASIVAKVHRDAVLRGYDQDWPEYGFGRHKGYGTRAHMEALRRYGSCPVHRRSFAPVAAAPARGAARG